MMDTDLTCDGWAHNTVYGWGIVELCTWNLYNLVNACHPKFLIKRKKQAQIKFWKFSCTWTLCHSRNLVISKLEMSIDTQYFPV